MDGDGFEVAARKVAPLLWSEDCCLGVPALDADHQLLFELVGTFIDYPDPVPPDVVNVLLGSLREYAALHFEREETWQREIGYPGFAAHRAQHDAFVHQLALLRQAHADDPGRIDVHALRRIVRDWVERHVMHTDRDIADWLQQQQVPPGGT